MRKLTVKDFEIGMRVVYSPRPGVEERGTVTSIGVSYVQVRYDGDRHSKATAPDLLRIVD